MYRPTFAWIMQMFFVVPALAGSYSLTSVDGLKPSGTLISVVDHRGQTGLRVLEKEQGARDALVIVDGSDFQDGTIELELAGEPRADARESMRGFVGVAFRVRGESPFAYECFYLRPTNGRADEQIRRNHSVQYVAHPEFPWHRLRKEFPGGYESYVDLEPGAWTRVRIEVSGSTARLYVHGADQPTLIVNDLKHGVSRGAIALWIAEGTLAHFRNLKITPQEVSQNSGRPAGSDR